MELAPVFRVSKYRGSLVITITMVFSSFLRMTRDVNKRMTARSTHKTHFVRVCPQSEREGLSVTVILDRRCLGPGVMV